MAGPDIVMAGLILTLAVASLYALHARVKLLEFRSERDASLFREWRLAAGNELDLLRELAKNHEARIADLEAAERAQGVDQVTPDEFLHFPPTTRSPMTTEPTPVPAPQPSLRKASLEVLRSAEAFLASSASVDEERFRTALEQLAEELGK